MGRGPKPAKGKAKPAVARTSPKNDAARVRDLEKRLAEALKDKADALRDKAEAQEQLQTRDRELVEAQDHQTATSRILKVISRSPSDVQPVFDMIAESSVRLCNASNGSVYRFDGELIHFVAHNGFGQEALEVTRRLFPVRPSRDNGTARAIFDRAVVHIHDVLKDAQYRSPEWAAAIGIRSVLAAPMLREGRPIGVITVNAVKAGPFSDRQVELLQTFADQALIAIENVRLFTELQASNRDLTTALDKQTATSDILRVISRSQTDVQPVFDAILSSAIRLMGAQAGVLTRITGDCLELAAFKSTDDRGAATIKAAFPLSLQSDGVHAKAIRDRAPVNIAEAQSDARLRGRTIAHAVGYQSLVAVPMILQDVAVGTISATRREPGGFTDDEIALLQTFADQAVIAIENVRLFNETKEALDQQTATSEILRVISSSPMDLQPVFDAILQSAAQLCEATFATLNRFDGQMVTFDAHHGMTDQEVASTRSRFPLAPDRGAAVSRAILDRWTTHIHDIQRDAAYRVVAGQGSFRTVLAVPLLRQGIAVGAIGLWRREVQPFSEEQINLVETFADQAVIAIENVRLFTELQVSNRELTTALDKQTATSEILRVISQSQTDVQPVFDAILASAVRLLGAYSGVLTRIAGDQIVLAALTSTDDAGDVATRALFPQALQSELPKTGQWDKMAAGYAQVIRERAPLNIADVHTDPRWPEPARAYARLRGYRSWAAVPMIRRDEAIGTISVTRSKAGGFTDDEIALLKTFADQAVIAIENVRLFKELEARTQDLTRSVDELTALGEVGRAVSSTLDLETVLSTIVSRAIQLSGTDGGSVYEYDEATEEFSLRASRDLPEAYIEQVRDTRPRKGEGAVGRVAQTRKPVQIADISDPATYESRVRNTLLQIGLRALLAVPLIAEDRLVGALIVMRKHTGTFAAEEVALLQTFATQSALAIQNARLFREIEEKSRQLEVASQHKSEFLANMSHELRTPLNAIIGFSEVLTDHMFGELNEKQDEYLKDIYASGTHLLSLINDILDLSKIEAGRMELELTDFHLPTALDNALTLVRERAGRRSITLQMSVDERLGEIRADERKIRQVVLNLLSNAIKFTPEGGRIDVAAVPKDESVEVSVSDTGVGIAPEDQEAVFEEFRQVGTAEKKVEGTGLGLTLCRKFVELHGGRIWVKSQVGVGSTFTFTIPLRRAE